MPTPVRAFALPTFFVLAFVAPAALAQIDLPARPPAPRGNVVPHHVCAVCSERNYNVPSNARLGSDGLPLAYCARCKQETAHRVDAQAPGLGVGGAQGASPGGLRLPPGGQLPGGAPAAKPAAPPAPAVDEAAKPVAPASNAAPRLGEGPGAFVFEELGRLRSIDDPLLAKAVESLAGMGEPGLAVARVELAGEHPARFLVAARVLLAHGTPADHDAVFARARAKLPVQVCMPLADELAKADPVRANPAFFAELLEHPSGAMRTASERVLRRQLSPKLVPVLVPRVESKRPEARQLALGLLVDIDDPAIVEVCFAHLADPKPAVAQIAVRALATRPGAEVDAGLLSRAFRQRWLLRDGAYALLALVEREERSLQPILDERHVDALLAGLESSDLFVSGSSAAALAGIGFRSAHPRQSPWLDREVVDRLVYVLSGKVFHDDLSSLIGPVAARLALVTGQEFGTDGPRWVEWWMSARTDHAARRAWIEVGPGDETALAVRWQAESESVVLLGPAAKAPTLEKGETIYLGEADARALLGVFQKEGLLGPEKLPGARGTRGPKERELDVLVDGRGKGFVCGPDAKEPWFERAAAAVRALRDANRWQRFTPAGRSQFAFWQEQAPWWALEHTPRERALREKSLVFAALAGRRPDERDFGVAELARVYEDPTAAEPEDFEPLLGFLRDEPTFGERAHRIARLALRSIQSAAPAQPLQPERARKLVAVLAERFGVLAREDLSAVLDAAGPAFARALVKDARVPVRAATASVLARGGTPDDVQALMTLAEDREPAVEIAAVTALGDAKIEAARTELVVRARLGLPDVRSAALLAIGRLGGEYVLDALLLGAQDENPSVRSAAARGLAELADPSAVPLLVSMLGEGSNSVVFGPARAGLQRLGEAAWPELLRAVHKTNHPARREAALILSEQGCAEPVTALIQLVSTHPEDTRAAAELCVLTGVDFRSQPDPASSWWAWYEGVVHDDAQAWFRAALERAGESAPAPEALRAPGTRAGKLFLATILARPEPHLAERARRELAKLLGRELDALPTRERSATSGSRACASPS
ncbi:MAG: HEAT repeat domain-containing protein [Planctomycetes bacterium]|nr:HEAT repeat domain-containing protein [Planctomycetota bacterium]